MTDVKALADGLTEAQRWAVTNCVGRAVRAGKLFPGYGKIAAQGWLRETDLIERYFHAGYLAYRLTDLGLAVRAELARRKEASDAE